MWIWFIDSCRFEVVCVQLLLPLTKTYITILFFIKEFNISKTIVLFQCRNGTQVMGWEVITPWGNLIKRKRLKLASKMNFLWCGKTNLPRSSQKWNCGKRIGIIYLLKQPDQMRHFHVIFLCRKVLEHRRGKDLEKELH